MPVRIYEISKKLGLDDKQVLAKARELGITARVASSSLDKITAEYLEDQLRANPPPSPAPPPQPSYIAAAAPDAQPPAKPAHVTIHSTNPELHSLLDRILTGQIPLFIEVSREDGSTPVRAKLVSALPAAPPQPVKPALQPIPRAELDDRTKDLFLAAYFSARHVSKDDWVNLAEYGSALKRQDPTFQPQDFGERTLGGLVRRMIDDFDIKADNNTPPVYYIRLKPNATNKRSTPPPPAPPPPQPSQPRRQATGRVHNLKLGFGFIAPDDGSDNVFFHATEIIGCTIFDLRPGDPVEYEAGTNERGPCAYKVRRLGSGAQTQTP